MQLIIFAFACADGLIALQVVNVKISLEIFGDFLDQDKKPLRIWGETPIYCLALLIYRD